MCACVYACMYEYQAIDNDGCLCTLRFNKIKKDCPLEIQL